MFLFRIGFLDVLGYDANLMILGALLCFFSGRLGASRRTISLNAMGFRYSQDDCLDFDSFVNLVATWQQRERQFKRLRGWKRQ